ncbi:MAG: cyclic pyranopterin monophosphate synthase MoaC [Lachnospiraceae bacterium]
MDRQFTHFDEEGNAIMVDVSDKDNTVRKAIAKGRIHLGKEAMEAVLNHKVKKGDVLGVARVAGIMALKNTSSLIPMCHPLFITGCGIEFENDMELNSITAYCTVSVTGKTGVEMEALVGVSTALLTIYDMCKAINREMEISDIMLVEKSGGKSGTFKRD